MDSAALLADVEARPAALTALAAAVDDGLLARLGPFLERRFRRYRLIGMGASHVAAEHAATRLRSLGVDAAADLASSPYGYPMDAETLTVAVSASGSTTEVLEAVERLDGRFPVLALTGVESSPLAQRAGSVLPLTTGADAGTARSFTHAAVLLHGLTLLASGGLPRMVARDVAVLAERAAAATSDLLARRADWLPATVNALDARSGPGVVGVVAPAERLGAAHRSAQVLRTTARRVADSCESAEWLHTHAHLTSSSAAVDYRALVLTGSRSDRRVLDRLGDRGACVVAVGDGAQQAAEMLVGRARLVAAVEFTDDDDTDVARLAETCVAEVVAASL